MIWGPFGRNLPEDEYAIIGQSMALHTGEENTFILHGREEPSIQDEEGMRHYYAEWGRRMGRSAADPFNERSLAAAE